MLNAAAKLEKALALRATGHSWAEIAHSVGYRSGSVARTTVSKALKKRERDSVDELVAVEAEKMRLLERAGFEGIARGELENIPRIVGVMQRRAAMLGLDKKNQADDYSMVDQWLQGVIGEDDLDIEEPDELAEFEADDPDSLLDEEDDE
ncbi:hypothetical protein G352_10282 [Rhodococcus ruber BKS 20-38]|uniref:Uncharacterized protein n=1 Tax=Rhodococcus ruber BKS 20-38 TaxID=1278076 RepID=M2XWL1_9NOCA|nr:hypothetical protein [Rhodococcus ruber]EME65366.1 hypothetical protein G352_10282 [Rhodococcus ruber BKS 20-38]